MGIVEFEVGTWIPWIAAGFGLSLFAVEVIFVVYIGPSLRKIHGNVWANKKAPNSSLTYSPNSLQTVDLVAIVIRLLLKYVPGYSADLHARDEGDGYYLPSITLEGPLRLSSKDLSAFLLAMQLPRSRNFDHDAASRNQFLLVSITTPMLLILLSHPRCPINPIGAVNTHNRFSFCDPDLLHDTARLLSTAEEKKLSVKAEMGGAEKYGKRKRRGVEFSVCITVLCEGKPLLVQDLSFLQFLAKSRKPVPVEDPKSSIRSKTSSRLSEHDALALDIDERAPMRWAGSCKDYNPIHVSNMMARLLGFPSIVAHGSHVTALIVQALHDTTINAQQKNNSDPEQHPRDICWMATNATWLEITFLKPMTLPITLGVQWESSNSTSVKFIVHARGEVNAEGRLGHA